MAIDLEKLTTASPLLHGEGLISICEAAKAIGLSDGSLISELLNDRAAVFTHAPHWQGWHVENLDLVEQEPEGGYILNSVEAVGIRLAHSGPVRSLSPIRVFAALLETGTAADSSFRLQGKAAFFTDNEITIPLSSWMIQKSSVERVRERLARGAPPDAIKSATSPINTLANDAKPGQTRPIEKEDKRFSYLFELYSAHQKWTPAHEKRMGAEAGMFTELMNDPPLADIGVEMIHKYAALLAQLPERVDLAKRQHPNATLRDLMEVAKRNSIPLKSQKTVSDHVARLGQVFAYAVSPAGMMHVNPADKFKRRAGNKRRSSAQKDRDAFTASELSQIFSKEWFIQGTGAISANGHTNWRPHHFWLPVLALTTGARLNELSQLYLSDIRQSDEDGSLWYLDFNLEQSDKIADDLADADTDKSLKNTNSERIVPLHDLVIRAGLFEYVEALREAGESRLFPELKHDALKGYGKPAGSWFNERFLGQQLGMRRNGKKTFHSFRHTFATLLERAETPERVMAQLLGHERGETQGSIRYAKDRNATELKPIIDRLSFPALESLGRFDPGAGLRAIKWAKRMKQAIARSKTR